MFNAAQTTSTQVNPLSVLSGINIKDKPSVRAAAEDFESVFLNNMLQTMFTGLENGGTWGSGEGAEAWQGLMINEYAQSITKAGGIGLADAVERELLALQEASR